MNRDAMRRLSEAARAAGARRGGVRPRPADGRRQPARRARSRAISWRRRRELRGSSGAGPLEAHRSQTTDVGMMLSMPPEMFAAFFAHEHYIEPGRPPGMVDGLAVRRLSRAQHLGRPRSTARMPVVGHRPQVAGRLLQQGPRRRAARLHHPVELVELQQPHPHRRRADDPGAAGAGGVAGSPAADHHRAHQRVGQPGHPGAPGPARPLAARRRWSPPRRGPRRARRAGRWAGCRAPRRRRAAVRRPGRAGAKSTGSRERREGRVDQPAAAVHLPGAADQVDADHRQLAGQPLEHGVGAVVALHRGVHPPPAGERAGREPVVAERPAAHELGVADLLEGPPRRCRSRAGRR